MAANEELQQYEPTGRRARLARVYAESLLALALKTDEADTIGEELATFAGVMRSNPMISVAFASPAISAKDRLSMLGTALTPNASLLFQKFVGVLNKKRRLADLPVISSAYLAIRDEQAGRVRVLVRSAVALSDEQQSRLSKTLGEKLKKQPVLNVRTEPELLGGLIVQVGDRVYDSSVRTRLNNIRNHLLASGSYV